ncbi:HEAT repeat domain-containing protein [Streptomyces sp. NPDC018833]|uniref:HEAT repeat domain-containing protein n=1 Tax=Streptomyces sp. NPDC018833 TaxID=3365053 RepID=UPI0037B479FD
MGDPRCGPALIGLLDSDNPTVREWAAMALASLEIDGAIEPLRRAYRACLERATPPDWTESVGIRWALTELDTRSPVVPPLTARLRATTADDAPGWPTTHFTEIINDLADHAQVILYSQFWRVDAGRTYGVSDTGLDWELDWTAPWEHLVEESRTWSLLEASEAPAGDNIFVVPTWIDRTDLRPEMTDAVPAPQEIGYGHVVESYVTRMYAGLPRYLVLNGGRFLSPGSRPEPTTPGSSRIPAWQRATPGTRPARLLQRQCRTRAAVDKAYADQAADAQPQVDEAA